MAVRWLPRKTSARDVERRLVGMTDGSFQVVAVEVFDHPDSATLTRNTVDAEAGTVTGPWCLGPEDEVRAELERFGYEEFEIQASAGNHEGREDPTP